MSISGFGATGPLKNKPGYDLICSAMYGIMHLTGIIINYYIIIIFHFS